VSLRGERRYQLRCIDKSGVTFQGDERLLDVGCGNGRVARLLRERVAEVVAIDIESSSEWQDAPGLTFQVADGEQLPFADASFDIVHSKDSLHHMNDPAKALAEYRRVLRAAGTLLVIESNRYNPVFYVHMTRMLGHEHFPRRRFHELIRESFPHAQFRSFEAHYVPAGDWLLPFQHAVEETLERIPGLSRLVSYNVAVARV
jgi:ubiquinone/menaquinone biosynthesis C-methylase UbiE